MGIIINMRAAYSRDVYDLESYLSRKGVVGNGSSDDAPGLLDGLLALAFDGKFKSTALPEGGLSFALKSAPASGRNASLTAQCLEIPANISLDLRGGILDASSLSMAAGHAVVAIGPVPGASVPYGNIRSTIKNGTILGHATMEALLFLGHPTLNAGPAHANFEGMYFDTGFNLVVSGSNSYNWRFDRCEYRNWGSTGWAITSYGGSSNWGECLEFGSCIFYNGAGGVLRARGAGAGTHVGYQFNSCRADYVRQFIVSDAAGPVSVVWNGGHLECNKSDAKYAAANHAMVSIAAVATETRILLTGVPIVVKNPGGGNTMAYLFDSGATGAAAPYGIVLDRCSRQLNTATLNNVAATGRFVDNS